MKKVTSKDGTTIAYDQVGRGLPVILVGGALGYRAFAGAVHLAELLAPRFTAITYDRRGRGDSGNTLPYAVQREVEDIEALIDAVGGSACVYGNSSGAVLALEAASQLAVKVKKLVMFEPPFILDNSRPPIPPDYVQHLNAAIAAGRPGDAVEIFLTEALQIPAAYVGQMRNPPKGGADVSGAGVKSPEWDQMERLAHTLPYDFAVMGSTQVGTPGLPKRWASATMPTLVATGGNSEAFFDRAAETLVALLPQAEHRRLAGQNHAVAPDAIAPLLMKFFAD